jgi:hypothetical protein
MAIYRGAELEVVEDTAQRIWTWTMRIDDPWTTRSGSSRSRLEAMFAAEHAIDRVLDRQAEPSRGEAK